MDLEELKATAKASSVVEAEYVGDEEDEQQILVDLHDAFVLLSRCMYMLNFMGDADLLHSISRREREIVNRLAGNVKEYLDEIGPQYEE